MNLFCRFLFTTLVLLYCHSVVATTYDIGTEDVEYYPHYGKTSPTSSEFEGFARLFFDDFSAKKHVSIEYVPLPIKRLYSYLFVSKTIGFKYPDSPNWNAEQKSKINHEIYYSEPIVSYIDGIFVHKDNVNLTLDNIKTLGVIRGFTPEPFIDYVEQKKLSIFEYSRSEHLLMALKLKRIEAAYINVDVANYQIKSKGISGVVFQPGLPFTKGMYHISTLKHPDVINLIDQYIKENGQHILKLKEKLQLTSLISD
jgi:hypothetical protein